MDEDDTPETTPYEIQIPDTLKHITVNSVRALLESYQRPHWLMYNSNGFCKEQEYAELLHTAHFLDETDGLRESLLAFTEKGNSFSDKGVDFIMHYLELHQKFNLPVDILHLASITRSDHAKLLKSNRVDLLPAIRLMQRGESMMEKAVRLVHESFHELITRFERNPYFPTE